MRHDSFKDTATNGKLHLFSIYTDFGAYKHIKWTVSTIAKLTCHRCQSSSEIWKLDSLTANESMHRMLAKDGANADVLIVAVNSLEYRTPELIQWLDSLTPLPPYRTGLMIGLLGDEENKSEELDWTARQLIRCAHKTNRKFIWHWTGLHNLDDTDWLVKGVETLFTRQPYIPEEVVWQEALTASAS